MKNKVRKMVDKGMTDDEIIKTIAKDERVPKEKKIWTNPPRVEKPSEFYTKNRMKWRPGEKGRYRKKPGNYGMGDT